MGERRRIVAFPNGVSCRRDAGPLGLTLIGRTGDLSEELATLTFAGAAPAGLPEALEDASVERLEEGRYRICSGQREWIVPARSVHLHLEVSAPFYRAIAPRRVPWSKQLFWHIVLAMAASRMGKSLLLRLRRR